MADDCLGRFLDEAFHILLVVLSSLFQMAFANIKQRFSGPPSMGPVCDIHVKNLKFNHFTIANDLLQAVFGRGIKFHIHQHGRFLKQWTPIIIIFNVYHLVI